MQRQSNRGKVLRSKSTVGIQRDGSTNRNCVGAARIGDARSTYEDGILSRVNARAAALGLAPGMSAREAVALLRRAFAKETNR